MKPTCEACGWIHSSSNVIVAGSRFKQPIDGFRSVLGGPVRATREEAMQDWCEAKRAAA